MRRPFLSTPARGGAASSSYAPAMSSTARLKALDGRVLPQAEAAAHRAGRSAGHALGVVASLAFITAAVAIEGFLFSGAITMMVLTVINARQWRRLHLAQRDPQ